MKLFTLLLLSTTIVFLIPICILGLINIVRDRQPGCSGSHDCVIYKGERVTCPSCEIREFKESLKISNQ